MELLMQSLKEIKRRVSSIKGTMKITGALKLISVSKLKRAQKNIADIKRYDEELKKLALKVAVKNGDTSHPAFILREKIKKTVLIVITAEKGFCGSVVDNMVRQIKHFTQMLEDRKIEVTTFLSGNKGARKFKQNNIKFQSLDFWTRHKLQEDLINDFAEQLLDDYYRGEIDQVILAYNKYISNLSHRVVLDMYLPIWVRDEDRPKIANQVDYLYDPTKEGLVKEIIDRVIKTDLKRAMFEASASELASRMIAMDEALRNAKELVHDLGREYNRVRQTAITREIMDIVIGAEVLNS